MTHLDQDSDRTLVARPDPFVGTVLARRYRIERLLAAGGFGAVYRAVDVVTEREVALKILHRELTSAPSVPERFEREAKALAQLKDPHTVTVYDAGEADGTLYIVMELLSGESLHAHFRDYGPLPWERVVTIMCGVCSSLAEAHKLGIVHRDLKPANIHLEQRGGDPNFAKVLDFGIAKVIDSQRRAPELTQLGELIGTFDYMPAEQLMGGSCTPRTDVFTLGVVMYEMISGRRPYGEIRTDGAQSPAMMMAAVLGTIPAPLDGVPEALARIVARCLEREPEHRYADAAALAAALAPLVGTEPPPPPSPAELDDRETTLPAAVIGDDLTWIDLRPKSTRAATIRGFAVPMRDSQPSGEHMRSRFPAGTSPITDQHRRVPRPEPAMYPVARASRLRFIVWTVIVTAFVVGAFLVLAYVAS